MKLFKKASQKLGILMLAMMVGISPTVVMASESPVQVGAEQTIRLQDDFYDAVNEGWLKSAKINPGYATTDSFVEANDKATAQIIKIFSGLVKNEAQYKDGSTEKKMINLYKNCLNMEARNKDGIKPVKKYLDQIHSITKIEDATKLMSTVPMNQFISVFNLGVGADFKDSKKNSLYIGCTSLVLGDSDFYTKPSEEAKRIRTVTTKFADQLFTLAGYSEEEAKQKTEDIYKFEEMLAPSIMGRDEKSKTDNVYENFYNVYTIDELDKMAPNLHFKEIIKGVGCEGVKTVIVKQPKWLKKLNEVYTQDNIELIKNYMEAYLLYNASSKLGDDFKKAQVEYLTALSGAQGEVAEEEFALAMVNSLFSNELGKLYVEKNFSEKEKKDVEELVKEIIVTYKKKIEAVDWMSEATKKNALKKLDTMSIKIGYPNEWQDYSKLELKSYEEGSSLFENGLNATKWVFEEQIASLNKKVDRDAFLMSPQTVNAQYNPSANDITFPAGILQSPFYDINRKREANLGSIGGVIAHEISHAFDTTGANFDEEGNVKNWWTKEDYDKFAQKTNAVRAFYSNVMTDEGKKVNGDLTVGENVADITSISCMLDILKEMDHPDYDAFFRGWATTWRKVSSKEYKANLLQTDVHSPSKVRANIVLSQFQEFYDTYNIKETDKMYVKPEDRLKIY